MNTHRKGWYRPNGALKKHFFEIEISERESRSACKRWKITNPRPPLDETKRTYSGIEIRQICIKCLVKSDWSKGIKQ